MCLLHGYMLLPSEGIIISQVNKFIIIILNRFEKMYFISEML